MSRICASALCAFALIAAGVGGCGSEDAPEPPAIGGDYGAFFGVAPNETPNGADFARMTAGGVGSYHLLLSWQTIEQSKGAYDWSSYDAIFRQLATYGIEPIPYAIGTPSAYADDSSEPPTTSAEAFDAWADFLKAAAERYGPDGQYWESLAASNPELVPQPIRVWEIWNEPNSSLFWAPRPAPDDYAQLIKRSSRVIKSVDPGAEVMSGGMFITPQSDGAINSIDFLRRVYETRGTADAIDVIGIHPYGPTAGDVIDQVDKTRKLADEVDPDASLRVTEVGWGADPSAPNELAKTPERQGELLDASLGDLLERREELSLEGILWFTWRDVDTGVACGWCASAGLVDGDRDTKPAWLAFTGLTGGTP